MKTEEKNGFNNIWKDICKEKKLIPKKYPGDPEGPDKLEELIKYRDAFQENIKNNPKITALLKEFGFKSNLIIYDPPGRSQYKGAVYWYNLEILNRENVKKEYSDIWGFHIMPYCITEEDVINAEEKTDNFNAKKKIF